MYNALYLVCMCVCSLVNVLLIHYSLYSPTTVNMCYNSSPWQQTPPSFYRPQQAPSLELYGNAISLNRAGGGGGGGGSGGSGGSRRSSARRRPMGQAYNNYRWAPIHCMYHVLYRTILIIHVHVQIIMYTFYVNVQCTY